MTPILKMNPRHFAAIAGIFLAWWSTCWLFTGVYFDRETATALANETAQAENFVTNVAQGFERIIKIRMGTPNLLARDPFYLATLQKIGPVTDGAALPYAERQRLWTDHAVLASASQQLKIVSDEIHLSAIALLDAAGNCIAVSNAGTSRSWVGVNYGDREYFTDILAGQSGYRLNIGKQYGEAGMIFFTPIMHNGKVLGAIVAKANLSAYTHWLAPADAFITDHHGVILLARDSALQNLTTMNAPVQQLDAVKRQALYRRSDLSALNSASWGDPLYPELRRVEFREFPIIERSHFITTAPESAVYVLWPFPQLTTLATQRKITAIGSGIVGTVLLLLVFLLMTRARSLAKQVRQKEQDAAILNQTLLELHTQKALHDTIQKALADAGMQIMMIQNERIIHVGNRALAYRLGWSDAELNAHPPMLSIIHPDDQQRVADNHRRRLLGEAVPSHYELGLISRSGERFEFEATITSVPDSNPPCIVTISREIGERKRAERDLLLLRRAIDQSLEAYFLLDEDLCFIDVNAAACNSLGYSREELLGMTPLEIDPDLTPAMFAEFRAMQPGTTSTLITRHQAKDGNTFPVEISIAHFMEGGVHYIIALVRNITERKRMENMLLEQNLFLDSLLNAIPVPIFYKDKDTRYKGFNKAFEEFYGKDKDALIGKGVFDLFPLKQAQVFSNADADLFQQGGTQIYEAQLSDAHGKNHTVVFHKAIYYNKSGIALGQIGAILDVTEQRAMQLAIDKERATLRAFFNALPALAWMKDKEGTYLACNTQFEEFCGTDESTLRGKTDFDFFDADLALFFRKQDQKVATTKRSIANEEWVTFAYSGRCALLETVKAPVFDAQGELIGIIGVAHDITERKQTEQNLKEALALSEGIINAIPDPLFEMDRDGRYLNIWAQNQRTLTALKKALLGKTVFEVLTPEAAALVMASLQEAEQHGISYGKITPIVYSNGEEHWYENSIAKKQGRTYNEDTFIILSREVTAAEA